VLDTTPWSERGSGVPASDQVPRITPGQSPLWNDLVLSFSVTCIHLSLMQCSARNRFAPKYILAAKIFQMFNSFFRYNQGWVLSRVFWLKVLLLCFKAAFGKDISMHRQNPTNFRQSKFILEWPVYVENCSFDKGLHNPTRFD
jgi:hypothetical protein